MSTCKVWENLWETDTWVGTWRICWNHLGKVGDEKKGSGRGCSSERMTAHAHVLWLGGVPHLQPWRFKGQKDMMCLEWRGDQSGSWVLCCRFHLISTSGSCNLAISLGLLHIGFLVWALFSYFLGIRSSQENNSLLSSWSIGIDQLTSWLSTQMCMVRVRLKNRAQRLKSRNNLVPVFSTRG